jgi:DNA-binding response OmpR family regulator
VIRKPFELRELIAMIETLAPRRSREAGEKSA